jgi:hypothetical protein
VATSYGLPHTRIPRPAILQILLVNSEFIKDKVTPEYLKTLYPFPMEILESDDILQILESENEKYILLRNSRCGTYNLSMLVQVDNARTIGYFEKHNFWIYYSGLKPGWPEKAFKIMFKGITKSYL